MTRSRPAIERALVACGAGAILAGAATWIGDYGDPWPLLGIGWGALVAAGALRLMGRARAMPAQIKEELEFRRLVLAFGALSGASGAVVFALALARWQLESVKTQMLWITGAWAVASIAMAWRAVRRLATYLELGEGDSSSEDGDDTDRQGRG